METTSFFRINSKADIQTVGDHKLFYITEKFYAVESGKTKKLVKEENLVRELKEFTDPIRVKGVKYKFGLLSDTINQVCSNINKECQINMQIDEGCIPGDRNIYNMRARLKEKTFNDYLPIYDPAQVVLLEKEEDYQPLTLLAKFRKWLSRFI